MPGRLSKIPDGRSVVRLAFGGIVVVTIGGFANASGGEVDALGAQIANVEK